MEKNAHKCHQHNARHTNSVSSDGRLPFFYKGLKYYYYDNVHNDKGGVTITTGAHVCNNLHKFHVYFNV